MAEDAYDAAYATYRSDPTSSNLQNLQNATDNLNHALEVMKMADGTLRNQMNLSLFMWAIATGACTPAALLPSP